MTAVLITGGAGFFGTVLEERLLREGVSCVSLDLEADTTVHPDLEVVRGDIRDRDLLADILSKHRFDAVVHCAAILAHDTRGSEFLWSCNVDGTRILADVAAEHGVARFVFVSTNCLWGRGLHRPVTEDDVPRPVEVYGRSKWEGEKIVQAFGDRMQTVVLRTPTVVDAARLGLLAILFEFIREGRRVWVVGEGSNHYQFLYAPDLAEACILAMEGGAGIYNVGSDDVKPLREVYEHVIGQAGTTSRVTSMPRWPAVTAMKVANALRVSPLGPYHYGMIAEDFVFDTSRIKAELAWKPTLTNEEMLALAYEHYADNLDDIRWRDDVSAHRRPAKMGAIRLLKWLS